jgi:thiol:disulfide interchange protein
MDKEVFADPEVGEAIGSVVYLRLRQDENGKPFEDRWGRAGTPSFVVLRPDGSVAGKMLTGFIDVGDFLVFLDWAATLESDQPEIKTGGS